MFWRFYLTNGDVLTFNNSIYDIEIVGAKYILHSRDENDFSHTYVIPIHSILFVRTGEHEQEVLDDK